MHARSLLLGLGGRARSPCLGSPLSAAVSLLSGFAPPFFFFFLAYGVTHAHGS